MTTTLESRLDVARRIAHEQRATELRKRAQRALERGRIDVAEKALDVANLHDLLARA